LTDDSKKEIELLEDEVKDLFKNLSDLKLKDEISNLENTVEGVLSELSDLEQKLPNIVNPQMGQTATRDNDYILAVRRFQKAMKLSLLDGSKKREKNLFEQGFKFYENAESMILATGNQAELDHLRNEFAQALFKVVMMAKDNKDKEFEPFIIKSCQGLARINEDLGQYDIALTFHSRAGYLLSEPNPIASELEYFQVILDNLLIKDRQKAENIVVKLNIKHIKLMAEEILEAFNKKDEVRINEIIEKLEVLGAQRRIDINNPKILLDTIKNEFKEAAIPAVSSVKIPAEAKAISNEMLENIQNSLSQGIQYISDAYPNIKVDAQIDTKSIVSELKEVISSEISKEIKSLSSNLVTEILKNIPSGISSPRPRSGGQISDDIPEIRVVEGAPREKPERPKLDDMLDSIIVCE
jgi:hypothetical protein